MLRRNRERGKGSEYEFLDMVFGSMDDILIIADRLRLNIEYISAGAERLLGIPEAWEGPVLSLLEQIGVPQETINSIRYGSELTEAECWLRNLDRDQGIWCKCGWFFAAPFHTEEEKLIFRISDRSKEMTLLEKTRQELTEAKRSNAAKSRFLSTMSHDIRSPLNAIIGLTELVMEHKNDQERTVEYVHRIFHSSNYLLSLLNDVLDMSRIESGRMSLDYESFQMSELLESVTGIIRTQAEDKNQELETEWIIAHDSVNGDAVRIKQILINLLSNAVKYTPEGGKLFFQAVETLSKADEDDTYVTYQMKVFDNGYGMSEEFLKVIFEPFEKERTGIYGGVEGTGLGMAITKNLVEMMDGKISVESKLGEGTVFTVNLPLQLQLQETASMGRTSLAGKETDDLTGLNILLVEDNELTAEILKDILELTGCKVKWAGNGLDAVNIFRTEGEAFDAVLMDVQMPGMNGYEATKRIRHMSQAGKKVPIIALTGNAFTEDVQASKEAGMDRHISKPVQRRELSRVLREVRGVDRK
ncbi:response regulator [Anaerovorax odorimutans]|uniref:Stage 0 sporulation protein A homolog n=1 Tax=Anaerovorax odorimutans TaxID=109327 RepID=A0ABT1RRJ7_9FIRM|nr:response regulator [Anaerovorax odorimutans]MCQ4637817.1 response regulator [Anaerovorax odorimutans]